MKDMKVKHFLSGVGYLWEERGYKERVKEAKYG
jgi:hypothetical protein